MEAFLYLKKKKKLQKAANLGGSSPLCKGLGQHLCSLRLQSCTDWHTYARWVTQLKPVGLFAVHRITPMYQSLLGWGGKASVRLKWLVALVPVLCTEVSFTLSHCNSSEGSRSHTKCGAGRWDGFALHGECTCLFYLLVFCWNSRFIVLYGKEKKQTKKT